VGCVVKKLLAGALAVGFLVALSNCGSVPIRVVKPYAALTADDGYLAVIFTKKTEILRLGTQNLYIHIRQIPSNRDLSIPFGTGGELRLISVPPGAYAIHDFVHTSGIASVEADEEDNPGLIVGSIERSGQNMEGCKYQAGYRMEFTVNGGEIAYLGSYSWETDIFSQMEPGITVSKIVENDAAVLDAIRLVHPDLPPSIRLVSFPE
jgi:hypothetical protein